MLSDAEADRAWAELDGWLRATYASASHRWMDSGTSALATALRLATDGAASRSIALPAYGCYDLATACDAAGVDALLYDIDPATLGPSWNSLERALTEGAVAVVVVHLYGVPVDLDRIARLASRHSAIVIEDAAQGVGGTYHRFPLGSKGDLGVLSFGRGKGLTGGGGGALLGANRDVHIDALPGGGGGGTFMKSAAQAALSDPSRYWLPASLPMLNLGETIYQPVHPARGMSRSAAGILADNVHRVQAEWKERSAHAAEYARRLTGVWGEGRIALPEGGSAGWLRYPVLAPTAGGRDALSGRFRSLGISPGYPRSLADLPGFGERVRVAGGAEPTGARTLAARLVTLPTHGLMRDDDLDRVVAALEATP